ncbi:MAG: oligosaccharide flippase family protein, partial [Planctomycetota bacterium]|nr:oligosaccharide flippase family protein [Planctomycetota bacterium]
VLMAVAAYPLAIWYEDPKLAPMLWVMAVSLPLGTPAAMLQAKLRLDLRFKAIGVLMALSIILRQVLTIIFAKLGMQEMSLAAPVAFTAIFDSVAAWWVCNDQPWKKAAAISRWRGIFVETKWLINGTVASFALDWGPYVMLGKLLSHNMMGYYFFAYQITAQVGMLLAFNLQMVLMPVLAKLNEHRERQGIAFVRVLRGLTLVGSFLCMGIASVMHPLEHLLWRGKWADAVGAVIVFGIFYPWRVGFAVSCASMMAQGRFKYYSMTAWFEGITLMIVAAIGAWVEPTATSVAWWTGVCVMVTRLMVTAAVFRHSGISLKLLPGAVFPGWLVSVAGGGVSWWVMSLVDPHMSGWVEQVLPRDGALMMRVPEAMRLGAQVTVVDLARCMVAGCTFVGAFTVLTRLLLAGDLREAVAMAPAKLRGVMGKVLRV